MNNSTTRFEIPYIRNDFIKEVKDLNLRNIPMPNFAPDISIAEMIAIECFLSGQEAPITKAVLQNFRKYGNIYWKTSFYQ